MYGDYGYMEEGKLGKPYDFRLLRRLGRYGIPYKTTIAVALSLTLLITLFDLVVPYFSKIAIDRFIVSFWYTVDETGLSDSELQAFLEKYDHLLEKSKDGTLWVISHLDTKKIDPRDLAEYRRRGLLGTQRYYRAYADLRESRLRESHLKRLREMADGSFMIPCELLEGLSTGEVLKLRARDVRGVTVIALLFLFLLVLAFGLNYGEYYLLEFAGQRIMQDIRLELFGKMQSQAVRFFDTHPIGRLVTRVTNDIENLNEMFKSIFTTVFKDVFLLTGILAVLLALNWRLALISFILLPPIFGLTYLFSSLARETFRELRATVARINAFLQERLTGMRLIQLFCTEEFQMGQFRRVNHDNYLAGMKQIRVFAVFMPLMELFSSFAVALLLWYGGGKVIQEQLSLGALVAFLSYIQMFFKPVRDISEKYNIMQSAMASTERIFEFMDMKEEIPEPESPWTPRCVKGCLSFSGVWFGYEDGQSVLKDVSFEVKPGQTVAIVGATGSGKTTVINLVERFYDPQRGVVLLDGVDLRKWSGRSFRTHIGLCLQDVFIFSGKLEDNISLGREGLDGAVIEWAARMSNALPFIERLQNGFQQHLGEGGSTLSAGERQLLSFARAMASNPRLLVLDEATSSVDPETERLIQEAISGMTRERTTLIVAHRLSTVRDADRILVMHQGRIVERGNHEELVALGGIYSKLLRLRED